MGQITWKNINAPDAGGAAYAGNAASTAFQRGFDAFDNMFDDIKETEQDNWDNQKTNNTNDLLAQINSTNDLDALAQLKQSLTPEAIKEQHGAQVDLTKVMNALGSRDNTIQADITADQEFADKQEGLQFRDEVAQIKGMLNSGDSKLINQAKDALNSSAMPERLKASLYGTLDNATDELTNEAYAATKHANSQTLFQEKQTIKAQIKAVDNDMSQLMVGAPDATEVELRNLLTEQPAFKSLSGSEQIKALDRMSNLYQKTTGLTKAQSELYEMDVQFINNQATQEMGKVQTSIDQLNAQHPIADYGGNLELENLVNSELTGRDYVLGKSDDNNIFDVLGGDVDGSDAVDKFDELIDKKLESLDANLTKTLPREKLWKMAAYLTKQTSDGDYDPADIAAGIDRAIGMEKQRLINIEIHKNRMPKLKQQLIDLDAKKRKDIHEKKQAYINVNSLTRK